MKSVPALNLGSIDAVNYRQRSEKEFLAKILYRERFLDEVLDRKKYFLIGEKGTGKTSFAVFLQNNDYASTLSSVVTLSATDYQRFVTLKRQGKLDTSTYVDIWKVILLLLVADTLNSKFSTLMEFAKFRRLREAVNIYYKDAFRPEVDSSLELVKDSQKAAEMLSEHFNAKASKGAKETTQTSTFQISLLMIERLFEDAIASIKLDKDFILFIDGIDIRPDLIDYEPYLECVRGLANAVWLLNTEYFANIRDSRGRIKVVLLMRPDILDNMGFQNLNAKVRDNGIQLNWETTFGEYRTSAIFSLIGGILGKQQDSPVNGPEAWDYYFPFDIQNQQISEKFDNPFIGLLRYSFYRPRDIVQYLQMMQDYVTNSERNKSTFTEQSFQRSQIDHSDYLLGEVKDYLRFYYSDVDFDQIVGFFSQMQGRSDISWEGFKAAYARHLSVINREKLTVEELGQGPEEFLQFLYALDIMGYVERTTKSTFVHYCFRDRTSVKLRPRVKYGLDYTIHPGLARALLVGGARRTSRSRF